MDELIKAIVVPLIDHPDQMELSCEEKADMITYTLTVSKSDIGKIIGKNGTIASAIRTVLYASDKGGKRIRLLIRD
ncbi:MAG: KH domain-containing protein [Sporolactobacillus sp.]